MEEFDNAVDELKEYLEGAHGEMTIKVEGMIPHIEAEHLNYPGALMCAFGALHSLCRIQGDDFDEIVDNLKTLNKIMGYEVRGNLPGGKTHERE